MSEEKKDLSLSDLGLEDEMTPAEQSVKENNQTIVVPEEKTIVDDATHNTIEIKKSDIDMSQFETGPKKAIPRPDNIVTNDNQTVSEEGYKTVEIKDIAKTYTKKFDPDEPAKRGLTELKNKVDAGIERTINELTAPDGRIAEGKRKYVEDRYKTLMQRAEKSPNLKKKIKFYQDAMEEDPAFDGADEYEKKGYILFKVAKDDTIGIDDKSFGLDEGSISRERRTSADNNDIINNRTKPNLLDDSEDQIVLSDSSIPPIETIDSKKIAIKEEEEEENEKVDPEIQIKKKDDGDIDLGDYTTTSTSSKDADDEENLIKLNPSNKDKTDDEDIDTEEEKAANEIEKEFGITTEEFEKMRKEYYKEARNLLNITNNDSDDIDYSGYAMSSKPINITEALRIAQRNSRHQNLSVTWALPYTGIPIRMTAIPGEELVQFLSDIESGYDQNRIGSLPSIAQLTSIWGSLYNHTIMENKPSFNQWLKRISANDFPSILFALYLATFKDTNYITYRCTKKGCAKLYLEKHDVLEMLKYPNDKIKERVQKILNGDEVKSKMYRTEPVPINDTFAIGFITPSIYSTNFEQACLPYKYRQEHMSIVGMLPTIDKVYVIDKTRNTYLPVDFGIVKGDLEKTTKRKVKALEQIFESFTLDQRNIVLAEFQKITTGLLEDEIGYVMPKSVCPVCGTEIPESEVNVFTLLFTRARLSIDAASTLE